MCGISGIWLSEKSTINREKLLSDINSALDHRGPDDSGIWFDDSPNFGLAHKRLSIIDLSKAGHQPMVSDSGRYIISLNGEIYNHLEIKKELTKDKLTNLNWKGKSDTETLIKAIDCWGLIKTLEKITGMFALALWDRKTKRLSLVRDRFGEKPLYYGKINVANQEIFCFASELSAFEIASKGNLSINLNSLNKFFSYCCITAPDSIYKDIYQLKPGHLLQIENYEQITAKEFLKQTSWWSLYDLKNKILKKDISFQHNKDKAINLLDFKLNKTIESQSLADVPLGVFLSSGIDSSLITAIYQSQSNRPISTFTIGFPDMGLGEIGFDESQNAKSIANYLKTDHTEIPIRSNEIISHIPEIANIFSEPFADSSQIPTFLLSKTVRESGLKVALSGDGGDELFGGYNRHYLAPNIYALMKFVPERIKPYFIKAIMQSKLKNKELNFDKRFKLVKALKQSRSLEEIYFSLITTWDESDQLIKSENLSKGILHELNPELKEVFKNECFSKLEKLLMADTLHYLPNDILVKVDRSSMFFGLETRAPFLDHIIAEYVWGIPDKLKVNYSLKGIDTKYILKKLTYKYLPKKLVSRPKAGFAIPIGHWLRGPLKEWGESIINSQELISHGILNYKVVKKTWTEHIEGKFDHTSKLWTILMWQSWANKRSIKM